MEFVMKYALVKLSSLFMFPAHLASCLSRSLEKKWKGRHLTIVEGTLRIGTEQTRENRSMIGQKQ